MGLLMAMLYDRGMRTAEQACLAGWRRQILAGLSGDVLEVGGGTGANLEHYPATVRRLVVTEPDRHMRRRLVRRLAGEASGAGPEVAVASDPLGALPLPDGSVDGVVSTLVLCSVDDPAAALADAYRVLRPGGRFAFLEHVAAEPGSRRQRWQRRIEPLWRRLAGNCHLTRRTEHALHAAGFEIEWIERDQICHAIPLVAPSIRGVARKPA